MKKTKTAKAATPAASAPVPTKKKAKAAAPSSKLTSPKVTAAAAAAVAPTAAPAVKKPVESKPAITKISVKIDVGFGNTLFIRGDGSSLSWERGVAMNCINDDEWSITLVGVSNPVVFKVLVNDLTWSLGEDYYVQPGDDLTITPTF